MPSKIKNNSFAESMEKALRFAINKNEKAKYNYCMDLYKKNKLDKLHFNFNSIEIPIEEESNRKLIMQYELRDS